MGLGLWAQGWGCTFRVLSAMMLRGPLYNSNRDSGLGEYMIIVNYGPPLGCRGQKLRVREHGFRHRSALRKLLPREALGATAGQQWATPPLLSRYPQGLCRYILRPHNYILYTYMDPL